MRINTKQNTIGKKDFFYVGEAGNMSEEQWKFSGAKCDENNIYAFNHEKNGFLIIGKDNGFEWKKVYASEIQLLFLLINDSNFNPMAGCADMEIVSDKKEKNL